MENIEDLTAKVISQSQTPTTQAGPKDSTLEPGTSKTFEEMDQKVINKLFKRLQEIFPKWREIWQSEGEVKAAKRQWAKTLIKKGVTDIEMVQAGLEQSRECGWVRPPSAGQFVAWCIESAKERAGIPGKDSAVSQVMALLKRGDHNRRRTNLNPAMYTMSRLIDWYAMKTKGQEDARKAMEKAYDNMVEHWMNGHDFYEQPTMIEDSNPSGVVTKASREKGKEALSQMIKDLK
jgi:hypothetical protein